MLVHMVKEAFHNMLRLYIEKRDSLQHEFDGAWIERNRPLLDELERDIRIGISRIIKHERVDDWSDDACIGLLEELRLRNEECERKVRRLAKIFPSK